MTLRQARIMRGLSRDDLAKMAGVSSGVIYRMETGQKVRAKIALRVLSALGLTLEQVEGVALSEYRS